MRWLRLGLRMAAGAGRGGLARAALMATGTAVGMLMALAALAVPGVHDAQVTRAQTRNPVPVNDCGGPTTESAVGVTRPVPCTGLRMVERDDAIGTRTLRRVVVADATALSPRPPGLAAYPGPGEIVVSPALAELLRTDERARGRFPQRVVGQLGPAGLVAPDELRAYLGVPSDDPFLTNETPIASFGALYESQTWTWTGMAYYDLSGLLPPAVALFVLAPLAVFIATCARLSSSVRDQRMAALRLLGVSGRQIAVTTAVETGAMAAVGGLLGWAAFGLLTPLSQGWHVGRLHWYASDVHVSPGAAVTVLTFLVLGAVLVAMVGARPARVGPLRVRQGGAPGRPGLARIWPLAAGLLLAAAAVLAQRLVSAVAPAWAQLHAERLGGLATEGLGTGLLLVAVGIPVVLPLVSWSLAGWVRRLPGTPIWLELATARLRHAPAVAPRLVAALAVTFFALGVGWIGTAVYLNDRDLTQVEQFWRPTPSYAFQNDDPSLVPALRAQPGVTVSDITLLGVRTGGNEVTALVTDCADLVAIMVPAPGESCVDGQSYRLEFWEFNEFVAQIPVTPGTAAVTLISDEQAPDGLRPDRQFRIPGATLHLTPTSDSHQKGSLLITRAAPLVAGRELPAYGAQVVVADRDSLDRAGQVISATTPGNFLFGDLGARHGAGSSSMLAMGGLGLGLSMGLGLATFVVAAVDQGAQRRRETTGLAVVGASARTVTAAEIAAGALPLGVGIALAAGATVVLSLCRAGLAGLAPKAALAQAAPALLAGGGAFVVGVILLSAAALATHRFAPRVMRRP